MTRLRLVAFTELRKLQGKYRMHLTFNDGTAKTVNFRSWLAATDIRQVA